MRWLAVWTLLWPCAAWSVNLTEALEARQAGRLSDAVAMLTTLNESEPGSARIQLELARALFEQGRYGPAKQLLDQVLEQPLPDQVRSNATMFSRLVDERIDYPGSASWQHWVSLTVGSSDRFSLLSDRGRDRVPSDSVDPLREERVADDHDSFGQLALQTVYQPNGGSGWLFDGYARLRDYRQVDEADNDWLQLRAGRRFAVTDHQAIDALLTAQRLGVDGSTAFDSLGMSLIWRMALRNQPIFVGVDFRERRYQGNLTDDPRDGERWQLELGQSGWFADRRWRWQWSGRYQDYAASEEILDYEVLEGIAAIYFAPSARWSTTLEISYADLSFVRSTLDDLGGPDFSPVPPSSIPGLVFAATLSQNRRSDRWQARAVARRQLGQDWHGDLGLVAFAYSDDDLVDDRDQSELFFRLSRRFR